VPLVRAIRYGCDLASVIIGVRVALPQDFLCAVRATFQISPELPFAD